MLTMPSIDVRISTSSPLLDLTSENPFTITLDLFLDHTSPVTFPNSASSLFNGTIFKKGGLSFCDVATGDYAGRNSIILCRDDSPIILQKDREESFTTLHCGQKHTITASIERVKTRVGNRLDPYAYGTVKEFQNALERMPTIWKWDSTGGLNNETTYEIGVDDAVCVQRWLEGTKEELLSKPIDERNENSMIKEAITIHVIQTSRFQVRRPDTDGSLDWP